MLSLKDRSHDKEVEFLIRWRKETERIYLSGHIRTRFNNKIDKNNTSQISFFPLPPPHKQPSMSPHNEHDKHYLPAQAGMTSITSPHTPAPTSRSTAASVPCPQGGRSMTWLKCILLTLCTVIICFTLTTKDWSSPASAAHQGVPTVTFLVSLKMSLMRSTMWSPRSKQTIITF